MSLRINVTGSFMMHGTSIRAKISPRSLRHGHIRILRFGINAVDLADIESTLKAIKDLSDRASAILRDVSADLEANK
jgi:hypothetical protein